MSELRIHKKKDGWWLEVTGKRYSGMFNLGFPSGHIIQNSLEEALAGQRRVGELPLTGESPEVQGPLSEPADFL